VALGLGSTQPQQLQQQQLSRSEPPRQFWLMGRRAERDRTATRERGAGRDRHAAVGELRVRDAARKHGIGDAQCLDPQSIAGNFDTIDAVAPLQSESMTGHLGGVPVGDGLVMSNAELFAKSLPMLVTAEVVVQLPCGAEKGSSGGAQPVLLQSSCSCVRGC
jgi:hypothetical protein